MTPAYLQVLCIEGGYFVARREAVEQALMLMRLPASTVKPELEAMTNMARKLSGTAPEGYA